MSSFLGLLCRVLRLRFVVPTVPMILMGLMIFGHVRSAEAQQWNLVWSDEFTGSAGSAPDPSKWTYDLGTNWGTGEVDTGTSSRANSYLDGNGHLVIATLYDSGTGVYTSAHLKTAGLYAAGPYGKIEASIQVPAGNGLASYFSSMGNDFTTGTPSPYSGGISVMEQAGRLPSTAYGLLQGPGYSTGLGTSYALPSSTFSAGYHTFGVIWTPFSVQWYVDGNVYEEVDNADMSNGSLWEANEPMDLLLGAGVGGSFAGPVNGGTTFPQYMNVDYVRVYSWTPPAAAPTNLGASAASDSQIALTWDASSTSGAVYNLYGSTNPDFALDQNTTLIASNISGTSYTVAGLYPATNYYYQVVASDPAGESSASNQASATTLASGSGTNGNAISIDAGGYAVGNFQSDVYFSGGTAVSSIATINTSAVSNSPPQQVYLSGREGASTYLIPNLNPNADYIVRLDFSEPTMTGPGQRVFNVLINGMPLLNNFDIYATAGGQNEAIAEQFQVQSDSNGNLTLQFMQGPEGQPLINGIEVSPGGSGGSFIGGAATDVAIDFGGASTGSFVADTDFNGGSTQATGAAIDVSGVVNPAPTAVYQSNRNGAFTYVISNLEANTAYEVRLHFAELTWTQPGQRVFNVFLNGNEVLSNFDIIAAAGAQYTAVIEEPTVLIPANGQLEIDVSAVTYTPLISGVEVIATPGAVVPPEPATELLATPESSSTVDLAWAASGTTGATYNLYRSTTNGFYPSSATQIATGLSSLNYSDSGLTPAATYYYLVTANNSAGTSIPSSQAAVTTALLSAGPSGLAIDCGGPADGSFVADVNAQGGSTSTTANTISVNGVSSPAPESVYQSDRYGTFNYTVPGLTPNAAYIVRLHFADYYWTLPGQREFNVFVNQAQILNNFDIIAAAGVPDQAVVETTIAYADAKGQIQLGFASGAAGQAECSGFEIVAAPTITVTSSPATLLAATVGVAYSATISASGGTSSYTYAISAGALPAGMSLSSTGALAGTPTAGGTFNFTVKATDSSVSPGPYSGTTSYSLTVNPGVATLSFATIPAETYGNPPFTVTASSASTGAITYSLVSGSATVSAAGLVTLTGAGAVTVEASQTATVSYDSAMAETTINVAQQPSQTMVSANPASITPVQTVTLTATVSATIAGTPAITGGTVTFYDNGVALMSEPVTAGVAQLMTLLPPGTTASITAVYSGDGNFLTSASTNNASVVITPLDFTFTSTGASAYTAAPGAMASYSFAVAPLYGTYAGPVSFTVTGLPAGASATFTPSTVAADTSGATSVVMTVQTASAIAHNHQNSPFGRGIVFALLLLPFGMKRSLRRKLNGRMLLLLLLLAGTTAAVSGCGSNNGFFLQTPQSYTLTVTATSGKLQHSQTVTLILQ